jgi:hypothetical protein
MMTKLQSGRATYHKGNLRASLICMAPFLCPHGDDELAINRLLFLFSFESVAFEIELTSNSRIPTIQKHLPSTSETNGNPSSLHEICETAYFRPFFFLGREKISKR